MNNNAPCLTHVRRSDILPHAVSWFTGEALQEDSEEEEEEEEVRFFPLTLSHRPQ